MREVREHTACGPGMFGAKGDVHAEALQVRHSDICIKSLYWCKAVELRPESLRKEASAVAMLHPVVVHPPLWYRHRACTLRMLRRCQGVGAGCNNKPVTW